MKLVTARDILTDELRRDYNHGRLLELTFYDRLTQLPGIRNILHETQLRRMYGWFACSVDFLIEFDHGIVLVQCKYRNTRRRETYGIVNYMKSVELIKQSYGKPFLFGLWMSRLDPFEDNKAWMIGKNIYTASEFKSIEKLIQKSLDIIINKSCVC